MRDSYSVIKSLIRTEKGTTLLPMDQYLFEVATDANKIQIKRAVEELYKVKVKSVNTITVRGKMKRIRFKEGKTPDWKKAVVQLKKGEKIEVT